MLIDIPNVRGVKKQKNELFSLLSFLFTPNVGSIRVYQTKGRQLQCAKPVSHRATRAYAANPSTVTLMLLNRSAISLLAQDAPPVPFDRKWTDIHTAGALANDFQSIRITIDRRLSDHEVSQAAGAVGYALREVLCGDDLGEPRVLRSYSAQQTILSAPMIARSPFVPNPILRWRSSKPPSTLWKAVRFVLQTAPGAGTQGTRLVAGIGRCKVDFAVR